MRCTMRLKECFFSLAVILVLCSFCSCAKGGNDLKIVISPLDKSLIDLASQIYDEPQLLEISNFDGSMNELNSKYPIECLRKDDGVYRVSYIGHGSIAVLLFDNTGNRMSGNIYNTHLLKSDFNTIVEGQLLEEVRAIDPNGEYLFLYVGRNDIPKISSHYTKDGYLITIEYDDSNNITSINEELI